ncbi:MAG: ATP-binding protein [Armatimonadota bacterium]
MAFGLACIYSVRRCRRFAFELIGVIQKVLHGSALSTDNKILVLLGDRVLFDQELANSVTELIDLAKSLCEGKRQSELIISNMADGIVAVDCSGRISMINPAAARMLGVKEFQVVGKRPVETDLHPEVIRLADECISQGGELTSEIQLPGRPPRVLGLRATRFTHTAGGSLCAIVMIDDLTQIRRHERAQKEFISNVSHELRTPLTAIRTTAETLLTSAKNDTQLLDRFLQTIIREADRLSNLVGDLIEIVRISSGVATVEMAECNVMDIVAQAVEVVRPLAKQKNITIEVDVPDGLVVFCDGTEMVHAVRNLVDNAVKYTPEGGSVSVSAGINGSRLYIRVKDTGIGIPQGEVRRIFERFYRVDKARSRQYGGTGLGLSIVKEIMDAHRGEVIVDTQLGKGSTFTLLLPLTQEDFEQSEHASK